MTALSSPHTSHPPDDDDLVSRGLSSQTISCPPLAAGDTNPLSPLPSWCDGLCCCCILQVFSQLGGLQLDRDIRSLVAAAGELSTKPVRDKFARLTQVIEDLPLHAVLCMCLR
jgi:hypothetical protein